MIQFRYQGQIDARYGRCARSMHLQRRVAMTSDLSLLVIQLISISGHFSRLGTVRDLIGGLDHCVIRQKTHCMRSGKF